MIALELVGASDNEAIAAPIGCSPDLRSDHVRRYARELVASLLNPIGCALVSAGRINDAERILRSYLALVDDPVTENHLGTCIARQNHHSEAEALLLRSYEALLELHGEWDTRTSTAAIRLVDLYDRIGDQERVAAWRERIRRSRHED